MLKRLRSAIYAGTDLVAAKAFYVALLGKEPYFDQPFYVGFDVDGFELGLDPDGKPASEPTAYWRVDSIDAAIDRAITLGAKRHGETSDVGGGTRMAVVVDPCGNQLGLIEEAS